MLTPPPTRTSWPPAASTASARTSSIAPLRKWKVVPPAIASGGRGAVCVRTKTGQPNGGSSPHQPRQSGSSGNEWRPNIAAPMTSAPTPSKYAAA